MDPRIEAFITDLEASAPTKAAIVKSVRSIFAAMQPALREKFIYGGIGMFLGEELIGGIFAYANHVTVEFSLGEGLADPSQSLEGKGKSRRHLKLRHPDDIEDKKVGFFIQQVVGAEVA